MAGRYLMVSEVNSSTSPISSSSAGVALPTGAGDRASAVVLSLPWTWITTRLKRIIRSRNLSTLGGISSRSVVESKGTIGLWSVSRVKDIPRI